VIHNVYNSAIVNNNRNRVSYHGGHGGINERATSQEETFSREAHIPPVPAQTQHVEAARSNPEQRASVNHGKPPVAATPKPGAFNDRAPVRAKQAGAPYKPEANRAAAKPQQQQHAQSQPQLYAPQQQHNQNKQQAQQQQRAQAQPQQRPESEEKKE